MSDPGDLPDHDLLPEDDVPTSLVPASERDFTCAHCGSTELDLLYPDELEAGDEIECEACGEMSYFLSGTFVDENEYHEASCEARESSSRDYNDDWHAPESFRPEY